MEIINGGFSLTNTELLAYMVGLEYIEDLIGKKVEMYYKDKMRICIIKKIDDKNVQLYTNAGNFYHFKSKIIVDIKKLKPANKILRYNDVYFTVNL